MADAVITVLVDAPNISAKELASGLMERAEYRSHMALRDKNTFGSSKSESDLLFALSIDPDNTKLIQTLTDLWARDKVRTKASVDLLERALAQHPDDPAIKSSLAWAYVGADKVGPAELDRGLKLLTEATAAEPGDPKHLARLAHAQFLASRPELARTEAERATEMGLDDQTFGMLQLDQKALPHGPSTDSDETAVDDAIEIAGDMNRSVFKANPAVSASEAGVAIYGFDPVAFFTQSQAVPGTLHYFSQWNGAYWLFESAANRDRFNRHPDRYAPQFGGFCSWCLATKHKIHGNPYFWAIFHNRLYLHFSSSYLEQWRANPSQYTLMAERIWPGRLDEKIAPAAPFTNGAQLISKLRTELRPALVKDRAYKFKILGDLRQSTKKWAGALAAYREGASLLRPAVADDPTNSEKRILLADVLEAAAGAQEGEHDLGGRQVTEKELIDLRRKLVAETKSPEASDKLASALGGAAFTAVRLKDYKLALAFSDEAIALTPSAVWLYSNRAHALMMMGRIDEARSIYLKFRGQPTFGSGSTAWEKSVREDFSAMRGLGIEAPLMADIERDLNGR